MPPRKKGSSNVAKPKGKKGDSGTASRAAPATLPTSAQAKRPSDQTEEPPSSRRRLEDLRKILRAPAVEEATTTVPAGNSDALTVTPAPPQPPATTAAPGGGLAERYAKMLHALSLVCSLQRVHNKTAAANGSSNLRPASILLHDEALEGVMRICEFTISVNAIAAIAKIFPSLVEVSWEQCATSSVKMPRVHLSATEVYSVHRGLVEISSQSLDEAALQKIEETSCAPFPLVAAARPCTPTAQSSTVDGFPPPQGAASVLVSVPSTPVRNQAVRQGEGLTEVQQPPPPSPAPRYVGRQLLGDAEIGPVRDADVPLQTRRSCSLDLPLDLLGALPEHKVTAVVESLRYEQEAAQTNLLSRVNVSADLEKLLSLYDLVKSIFGERTSIGGNRLLALLTSQSRFNESAETVERRLLFLVTFPESGLSARQSSVSLPASCLGGGAPATFQPQQASIQSPPTTEQAPSNSARGDEHDRGNMCASTVVFHLNKALASRKQLAESVAAALEAQSLSSA